MNIDRRYLHILIFILLSTCLLGQVSEGGLPLAIIESLEPTVTHNVGVPSLQKLQNEDEKNGWYSRVAAPLDLDLNLSNSGQWTDLQNGDRLWQLQINAKGAEALALQIRNYYIPKGAKLFFYSEDKSQILGAYTHSSNNAKKVFLAGIIRGESIFVEYFEPVSVNGKGSLDIFKLQYVYKKEGLRAAAPINNPQKDFGQSAACHININCPEAAGFEDIKRAVVRIIMILEEGMGYCSGSLLNNAREDLTPYVLSAYHCQSEYTPMYEFYRFDFNYEGDACSNPAVEPEYQSITGATTVAGYADTDFQLFELSENVPSSYNPYFLGWKNDIDYRPPGSNLVHHPQGDIKKYSHEYSIAIIFNNTITWDNGLVTTPRSHFRVYLDEGAFEGGSSGSPFMDNDGFVVGQLHGGTPFCDQSETFCGRLAKSWDGGGTPETRLKDWLDPDGSGIDSLDHFDPALLPDTMFNISGNVKVQIGLAFPNIPVSLYSGPNIDELTLLETVLSDDQGNYIFEDVPSNQDYFIKADFDDCHRNGVTTFDLILVTNHIIGVSPFTTPLEFFQADVSGNGSVTTFDIIQSRQIILQLIENYPSKKSFHFVNSEFDYSGMNVGDPLLNEPFIIKVPFLSEDTIVADFTGIKTGDLNASSAGCP